MVIYFYAQFCIKGDKLLDDRIFFYWQQRRKQYLFELDNMMNTKSNSHYQTDTKLLSNKSPIIQSITQTRSKQLTMIHKTLKQIQQITGEKNNSLTEIKYMITKTLQSKIINKLNRKSIYDLLNQDNKNFLINCNQDSSTNDNNITQNLTLTMKQKQIQKQKMCEFKQWIKNPELFESYFNTKLTKETLKRILDPKYELLKMSCKIETFLEHCGLVNCHKGLNNNVYLTLVDSNYFEQFLNQIQELIIAKRNKIIEQKQRILNILSLNIQNEPQQKTINFYMQNFVNLYQSLNSFSPETRFTTDQKSMQEFNFSIDHKTVVLRNPQLNEQKSYEKMSYESEFIHINDGEYVFNNEYRASYLCWEDVNDMQRSANTMIGSQYVMMVNEEDQTDCCYENENQGKLIQINNYLKSDKKICLRLRLNSVEFDKITIKILQSRTWQEFVGDKKEACYEFSLQIIPDEGDNRHIYGFTSSKTHKQSQSYSTNFPQQQDSNLDTSTFSQQQNQHQQPQSHLVLQDDIISLFMTSDEKHIVCWNQTRNHLIHQIHVQKPVINFIENFAFQLQFYVGIVLYTTVPEVEIYEAK